MNAVSLGTVCIAISSSRIFEALKAFYLVGRFLHSETHYENIKLHESRNLVFFGTTVSAMPGTVLDTFVE